jgi:transposase InsO family protein
MDCAAGLPKHSPWNEVPRYLIRDREGIHGVAVTRRLRAMGIRDTIAPGSPWQNSFAERLIGTIRRECVDLIADRPGDFDPTCDRLTHAAQRANRMGHKLHVAYAPSA